MRHLIQTKGPLFILPFPKQADPFPFRFSPVIENIRAISPKAVQPQQKPHQPDQPQRQAHGQNGKVLGKPAIFTYGPDVKPGNCI